MFARLFFSEIICTIGQTPVILYFQRGDDKAMIITRETDYAIRIIRSLYQRGKSTIHEICEEEGIPVPFAYKILRKLNKSGIVDIERGMNGGSRLKADLKKLTIFDVLRSIENSTAVTECIRDGYICKRPAANKECSVHCEFMRLQSVLEKELSRRSLWNILNEKT